MKIKMLRTMHVHPEPYNDLTEAKPYLVGEEYDVDELHAKQWIHARWAVAVGAPEGEVVVPIGPVLK